MKTIKNYVEESQLVANIVRSELNKGMSVYLLINNRTGNTVLTSQAALFGGKLTKGSIGLIAGNEGGMGDDTYSFPVDQIDTVEQLDVPFAVVDEELAKKTFSPKQLGFYFETSEELAQVKTNDFFWTKRRNDATDRNHSLLIGNESSYSGHYDSVFSKDFYVDNSEIVFLNEKTYNIHFNDDNDSNDKGFEMSYDEAMSYIKRYNGTAESYFADYKGGMVSIVDNETGETVYEEIVK